MDKANNTLAIPCQDAACKVRTTLLILNQPLVHVIRQPDDDNDDIDPPFLLLFRFLELQGACSEKLTSQVPNSLCGPNGGVCQTLSGGSGGNVGAEQPALCLFYDAYGLVRNLSFLFLHHQQTITLHFPT